MEKISYGGWPNCYRLSNGEVELVITGDVGPRIIRFGFIGGENEFAEFAEQIGQVGGSEWRIYGGHRLWHAPEDKVRTYYPDNLPVEILAENGVVRTIQPPETTTGIQKEITLLLKGPNQVEVRHSLRNVGLWPVELAPWALSVMAPGGLGIIPQPTRAHPDRLLPNRTLALWPYTDMADARVHWGSKFILLHQDQKAQTPFKIGLNASDGWMAYLRQGHLFLKTFEYIEGVTYPDHGCSLEMYTNDRMLELETLGPLQRLTPGDTAEHVEHWFLFRDVEAGEDEESIERAVMPLLAAARRC
ncbi:MAG: DUF4380 domain-containing protein [Anaerolineae bacterium]|nr:DUF4380 domain-containing protein [Anaerolineae bacterium]MDH7473102.1 hypothetical protein [Anaerolineae bacterium]